MRILTFFLILTAFVSNAQDSTNCNCCSKNYRLFDFWVGDWVVQDSAGTILGHNIIRLIENECALIENWTGAKGTTGTSISFYDGRTDRWYQSWIDANGGVIMMNGQFVDGAMILLTEKVEGKSGYIQNKTTWTPLKDGRTKHVWEVTRDGGESWQTVFEGFYSKKQKQ